MASRAARAASCLPDVPWGHVLVATYAIVNLVLVGSGIRLGPEVGGDWAIFASLGSDPYRTDMPIPFVWSPVMVPVMSAVVAVGYWPWLVAHVAVVFLLRSPLLIGLVLVSYGFWFDTAQGNTLTFSLVAGMLALIGNRWGSLAYLGLLVLVPRPLLVPLGVWILWKQPETRWPFAAMLAVHTVVVLGSGWAGSWIEALLAYGGPAWEFGPTAMIGLWWLVAGIPLAAWLAYRGSVGWAGVAMSPYLLPQYLVWPLLDSARRVDPTTERLRGYLRHALDVLHRRVA